MANAELFHIELNEQDGKVSEGSDEEPLNIGESKVEVSKTNSKSKFKFMFHIEQVAESDIHRIFMPQFVIVL